MGKLKQIIKGIPLFLWKYKFNIITLLYYSLISCYPSGSIRLMYVIGAFTLFFLHNIITKARFSPFWIILFSMVISFNAYLAFVFTSHLRVGLLASVLETNISEAESVLTGVFWTALGIFTLTTFLIYLSVRELKDLKLSKRKSLLMILIYCYALSPFVFRRILITDYRESYNKTPFFTLQIATNHYSPLVYGNVMTVLAYLSEIYTFWEYKNAERTIPVGVTKNRGEQKVNKIFLVIGESATPSKMSLYGYDKPTTQLTDSLYRADSTTVCFYNGTSTASYTRNAASAILSTSTAKDQTRFYQEKNLLELANEAGYETSWFSNQARMFFWDTRANYVGHISASAKNSSFTEDNLSLDDFALINLIDKQYKNNDELQFIGLHLIGSHYHYTGKYDDVDMKAIPGDESLLHMYDMSIHHTDRFLVQLYEKYIKNNPSAILYYVSDHGEDVGTDLGHGVIPISRVQFEVPFIVYNNSSFPVSKKVEKYMHDSLVSNASTLYILSEAMGYSIADDIIPSAVEERNYVMHGDDTMHKIADITPVSLYEESRKK